MRTFYSFLFLLVFASCSNSIDSIHLETEQIDLDLDNSFRGISVFENDVWISGTNATVVHFDARTDQWEVLQIIKDSKVDFRDIEALSDRTVIAVSAGSPALVYKTIDGGFKWDLVYENQDSAIFLDAMEFWDENNGLIFGDPMDSALVILKTQDGGDNWNRVPPENIPNANQMEGGFAASGSCLQVLDGNKAWIGTGGEQARIYYSSDRGDSWTSTASPIYAGEGMRGIYSLAFKDEMNGIAVGGEWRNEQPPQSRAYTTDGGKTWLLGMGVDQYRSGACYLFDDVYLATGLTGTDVSYDGGKTWNAISD